MIICTKKTRTKVVHKNVKQGNWIRRSECKQKLNITHFRHYIKVALCDI